MNSALDLGVHALRAAYRTGTLRCSAVVEEVLRRIAQAGDDKVWITRMPDEALRDIAATLDARLGEIESLPLYGVPFAVKDNIDVADLLTTAACPGFAYTPEKSATVVQQLIDAGAIVIGKVNLDQFATGLVGVRSPYGVPRNPFNPDYVPGGSSSGSAVSVSSGLVSFSLGTDTAGSGRIPAGFNNIVGLKPTPGLLSVVGAVPACASLDCISVFALSCADANAVLDVVAQPKVTPKIGSAFRFGVPRPLEFFGDKAYAKLYADAVEKLKALGGTAVEFDYAPFRDAAQLLYHGPWIAERTAAVGAFLEETHEGAGVWYETRQIILGGREYSAVDAFEGQYELAELKAKAAVEMEGLDFLALPTAGTIYTVAQLRQEPILYNSHLGHYTNFVNFFGLSALALPFGFRPDGLPFGITLVARANAERSLLAFGAQWQRAVPLPLGKTNAVLPPPSADPVVIEDRVSIAVVGAHMSDLPLNEQLTALGGRLEKTGKTAPVYRL
jgi:allophanate hydrolase